jgi:hypothetical protein
MDNNKDHLVLVPVTALYVRLFAAVAARVAACSDCSALPFDRYCLSHVCLDCGRMAHPHGAGCA